MVIDIKDLTWKDVESGHLYKVTSFSEENDVTLLWYKDMGTGEIHCMSANMFTLKHEACGTNVLENSS